MSGIVNDQVWKNIVEIYRQEGVTSLLLEWQQNKDTDVVRLLLALWLHLNGYAIQQSAPDDGGLYQKAIKPYRQIRSGFREQMHLQRFYRTLLDLELQLERAYFDHLLEIVSPLLVEETEMPLQQLLINLGCGGRISTTELNQLLQRIEKEG